MSRWIRCLSVCLLVFQSPMFGNTDWIALATRLEESVMQISADCSAFSIDDDRDYAATAEHCANEDPSKPTIVDLVPSRVVATDAQYDLTVLHVPGMDKKPMFLAASEPKAGAEAGTWGFGYGMKKAGFIHLFVYNREMSLPGLDGEWIMFNGAFVPGQSGSPVVNAQGEVVGMVQMTTDRIGFGRGADILRSRIGKYFAKPKQP